MLILARKVGQSIMIGEDVEITVIEVRGEQVRLGINAPKNVSVYRKELLDQIAAENLRAAGTVDIASEHLEEILEEAKAIE